MPCSNKHIIDPSQKEQSSERNHHQILIIYIVGNSGMDLIHRLVGGLGVDHNTRQVVVCKFNLAKFVPGYLFSLQ